MARSPYSFEKRRKELEKKKKKEAKREARAARKAAAEAGEAPPEPTIVIDEDGNVAEVYPDEDDAGDDTDGDEPRDPDGD